MTLYLKYRPQTVSDLDLRSVREKLTSLLTKKEIPHAFLFAGPRGTGKTSSARILAKAINCENKAPNSFEPCNTCDICTSITLGRNIDVVEMDAASNRGIDEIRSLKSDIMLSPVNCKKKIYIIDEVHMLTTEASNAFLKTLEEPPQHAIFILATTDPHKLPDTVLSRLCIINFERASVPEIENKLKIISEAEKFVVEDGVFAKIAQKADGSFRDAVKILEELSVVSDKITNKIVDEKLYQGAQNIVELVDLVKKGNLKSQIEYVQKLAQGGIDVKHFLNGLIEYIHTDLLNSVLLNESKLTTEMAVLFLEILLDSKAKLAFSGNSFLAVELALAQFDLKKNEKKDEVEIKLVESEETPFVEPPIIVKDKPHIDISSSLDETVWIQVLLDIRNKNAGVEALLRAAKPVSFDGTTFTIGVFFKFHKERLETSGYLIIVEGVLKEHFGSTVKVTYIVVDAPKTQVTQTSVSNVSVIAPHLTESKGPDIINAAKEIFGS